VANLFASASIAPTPVAGIMFPEYGSRISTVCPTVLLAVAQVAVTDLEV
jgi:hypothetical protein